MSDIANLQLNLQLPISPIKPGKACMVTVTLTNRGEKSAKVNRRMAVGTRMNVSRELFADVYELPSKNSARLERINYERKFASPEDYIVLQPGEAITTSFDLFKWVMPEKPGKYRIVMNYQADERLAKAPDDVVRGIYASEPVDFVFEVG
jgi:hypothetical protein